MIYDIERFPEANVKWTDYVSFKMMIFLNWKEQIISSCKFLNFVNHVNIKIWFRKALT